MSEFKTIGLIGKPTATEIAETFTLLYQHLVQNGFEVWVDTDSCSLLSERVVHCCNQDELAERCDLGIAVGGDGTFLTAARVLAPQQTPLIGVNLGRLGFLVDIWPDEMIVKLDAILAGDYVAEERHLLKAAVLRDGEIIQEQTAVNEVVVHRWITPGLIEMVTHIDGVFLNILRSDGLIISTPTGSTAYALSGGGPIIHPKLNAIVLVPINPHTMSNRPIVVDAHSEVQIKFNQSQEFHAQVNCDDLPIPDVLLSDVVRIRQAPKPIKILHPTDYDYYNILRAKLNWSSGYYTE